MATSNFTAALDGAFLSRSDAAILVPLPSREAVQQILQSTFWHCAEKFPGLRELAASPALEWLPPGRRAWTGAGSRKVVFEALSRRLETVLDPGRLTGHDLAAAVEDCRRGRQSRPRKERAHAAV